MEENFFTKLFSSTAPWYCTAELLQSVPSDTDPSLYIKPKYPWYHRWFSSLDEAIVNTTALDAQGRTMYMACATYKTRDSRKQDNVASIKAFWLDIDCGSKKPYPDQGAGCDALTAFVKESGLPFPCVINSGNGLYAYWFLAEAIPEPTWKGVASLLKAVVAAYGLEADNGLTANSACVLRTPGTHNRKNGIEKSVHIIKDAEPITFEVFTKALGTAAKRKDVESKTLAAPRPASLSKSLNASFMAEQGSRYSALIAADKCAQLRLLRDTRGDVPEPFWYACIGALKFSIEGNDIIHEWSSGYAGYTPEETEAKIAQHGVLPTTCNHFGDINFDLCVGCKFKGTVTSPLHLGVAKPVTVEGRYCPKDFSRSVDGLWYDGKDGAATPVHITTQDVWVESLCHDESLGYETIVVKFEKGFGEIGQFAFRAALIKDLKTFSMTLMDNHLQTSGMEADKCMVSYMSSYIQDLRAKQRLTNLYCQMGWKLEEETPKFILGKNIYSKGAIPIEGGFAKNVPEVISYFHSKGEVSKWVQTTKCFNEPDMYPYAFAFLAGTFGAPLMKHTGFDGAFISLSGTSGIGKSVLQNWVLSAYGKPKELLCKKGDTANMVLSRIGLYGSLPVAIDEMTNIEGPALSELVYSITQGRDRGRLNRDAKEKSAINKWSTLALGSSNSSLFEKLSVAKSDASAEMNRIFEINLEKTDTLTKDKFTDICRTFESNYGGAGEIYIQYLVDHFEEHQAKIDVISKMIDTATKAPASERFWSAIAATAIYGGMVAGKLGLIQFEVTPILKWVEEYIPTMREMRDESTESPLSVLAAFLETYTANILVVKEGESVNAALYYRELRGSIVGRLEMDTKRLFIAKHAIQHFCQQKGASKAQIISYLNSVRGGALKSTSKMKTLGAGVDYLATIRQVCWEIDLSSPELGFVALSLTRKNDESGFSRTKEK